MNLGAFGNLDWSEWLLGLWAAVIGGGASSVAGGFSLTFVDNEHFNSQHPGTLVKVMLTMFVVNGLISGFAFLRTKPLPTMKEVTHTVQETVTIGKPPVTTIVTTEEKTVVPMVEPKTPDK